MVTKRHRPDPLQPVARPMWLVIRDMHRNVQETTLLAPMTDLRAALAAARQTKANGGWTIDNEPLKWPFVFCEREGMRILIAVEAHDPHGPEPGLRMPPQS